VTIKTNPPTIRLILLKFESLTKIRSPREITTSKRKKKDIDEEVFERGELKDIDDDRKEEKSRICSEIGIVQAN